MIFSSRAPRNKCLPIGRHGQRQYRSQGGKPCNVQHKSLVLWQRGRSNNRQDMPPQGVTSRSRTGTSTTTVVGWNKDHTRNSTSCLQQASGVPMTAAITLFVVLRRPKPTSRRCWYCWFDSLIAPIRSTTFLPQSNFPILSRGCQECHKGTGVICHASNATCHSICATRAIGRTSGATATMMTVTVDVAVPTQYSGRLICSGAQRGMSTIRTIPNLNGPIVRSTSYRTPVIGKRHGKGP